MKVKCPNPVRTGICGKCPHRRQHTKNEYCLRGCGGVSGCVQVERKKKEVKP